METETHDTEAGGAGSRGSTGSAFTAGFVAARDGVVVGDNPHDEHDPAFWEWMAGWAEYRTLNTELTDRKEPNGRD